MLATVIFIIIIIMISVFQDISSIKSIPTNINNMLYYL